MFDVIITLKMNNFGL